MMCVAALTTIAVPGCELILAGLSSGKALMLVTAICGDLVLAVAAILVLRPGVGIADDYGVGDFAGHFAGLQSRLPHLRGRL